MSKTSTRKSPVANAFEQALGKDKTVKHFSLDLGKGKTEDFTIAQAVATILTTGMAQATKLDNYWQENAKVIVLEFWGAGIDIACEGMTAGAIKRSLRGSDDGEQSEANAKAYSKLFAALAQSSTAWGQAEKHAMTMNNHAKGSEDYDNAKILRDQKHEAARKVASRQAQTILDHFARQCAAADATDGATRDQMGARATIETTIADWQALIASMRGVYALPAERVLLSAACDALRGVLAEDRAAKNPQSLIAVKPKVESVPLPDAEVAAAAPAVA